MELIKTPDSSYDDYACYPAVRSDNTWMEALVEGFDGMPLAILIRTISRKHTGRGEYPANSLPTYSISSK